jgi:TPR repeat protein
VAKDEGLALVYLRRAVAADHQTARVALAWMLLEGEDDSCQDAVLLLKAAAERGPWGTCTHPARMFYASQELYLPRLEATLFAESLAEISLPSQGSLLRDGLDAFLAGDVAGALGAYSAAAELGYEVAQSNAAWLYAERCPGPGCELSRAEAQTRALHFLRMSAANGNTEAQRRVGDALWYGEGTIADRQEAFRAYLTAAAAGDMQSRFNHVALLLVGEVRPTRLPKTVSYSGLGVADDQCASVAVRDRRRYGRCRPRGASSRTSGGALCRRAESRFGGHVPRTDSAHGFGGTRLELRGVEQRFGGDRSGHMEGVAGSIGEMAEAERTATSG